MVAALPIPSVDPNSNALTYLNRGLANARELRRQVTNAHWNTGNQTSAPVAQLFDEMILEIDCYLNILATRLTSLGDVLNGRALVDCGEELLYPLGITDEYHHVVAISLEFASFGDVARSCYKSLEASSDNETAMLFSILARRVDQQLWRATPVARQLKLRWNVPAEKGRKSNRVRAHDLRGRFSRIGLMQAE